MIDNTQDGQLAQQAIDSYNKAEEAKEQAKKQAIQALKDLAKRNKNRMVNIEHMASEATSELNDCIKQLKKNTDVSPAELRDIQQKMDDVSCLLSKAHIQRTAGAEAMEKNDNISADRHLRAAESTLQKSLNEIKSEIKEQIKSELKPELKEEIKSELKEEIKSELKSELTKEVQKTTEGSLRKLMDDEEQKQAKLNKKELSATTILAAIAVGVLCFFGGATMYGMLFGSNANVFFGIIVCIAFALIGVSIVLLCSKPIERLFNRKEK